MNPAPLLDRVLDDEGITAGLDEAEAMLLVRELGDRVREIAAATRDPAAARRRVDALCREARQLAERVAASGPANIRADLFKRLLSELSR